MKTKVAIHGLMIEFLTPDAVLAATRRARQAGYREMDAYSPYTVEGLAAELGMRKSRIPSVVFIGALVGAAAGFFMQYYALAVDYPVNTGGRPYNSWPAFIPITFELMVLVGALCAFMSMVLLNELPHPNHPVFNVPEFARASQDRFFLCIEADDPLFDVRTTAEFLAGLNPHGCVIVVPVAPEALEEPEEGEAEREPRVVVTTGEVQS
jgi:Alternative complex III, ActD subunit